MTESAPTAHDQTASDLAYVKESIERGARSGTPAAIYALWGVISLVGFSLVDFAREHVGLFWLIAAPAGFIASLFLGYRSGVERGERHAASGRKYLLHWGSLLVAIAMTLPMVFAGDIAWSAMARLFLILIGLVYFLAGIHLDKRMLAVGLLILAGYVALLFSPPYGWTWTGVIVALALFVCAGMSWSRR